MPVARIAADRPPDLRDDERREAFGRLVEDQQARVGHQRAADREHLLLAARELLAAVAEPLGQAREGREHAVERPARARPSAPAARRHHEVLAHREVREDAAAFRHVADAEPRDLLGRAPVDVAALRCDVPPAGAT